MTHRRRRRLPKDWPITTAQPWGTRAERELRADRPGLMLVSLLTDEVGAAMIADGVVPHYLKQQARDALAWCATDERGIVARVRKGHKV